MAAQIIYWDSDAFLGWLQEEEGKVDLCRATLERAKSGEVLIVTSALTMAEVLWMKKAPKITQDKADIVQRFFRKSYIRVHNVTRAISEQAQLLVWQHNIKPKDAIHLATAVHLKVSTLETFDRGFIGKSGLVGDPLVTIHKPQPATQGTLDLGR